MSVFKFKCIAPQPGAMWYLCAVQPLENGEGDRHFFTIYWLFVCFRNVFLVVSVIVNTCLCYNTSPSLPVMYLSTGSVVKYYSNSSIRGIIVIACSFQVHVAGGRLMNFSEHISTFISSPNSIFRTAMIFTNNGFCFMGGAFSEADDKMSNTMST